MKVSKIKRDLVNSIILFVFALIFYIGITKIPVKGLALYESDFFPKIILLLLLFFTAILFLKSTINYLYLVNKKIERNQEDLKPTSSPNDNKKNILLSLIFLIYIFGLYFLGYVLSSIAFVFFISYVLSPKIKILSTLVLAIIIVSVFYLIFTYGLSVYLPEIQIF